MAGFLQSLTAREWLSLDMPYDSLEHFPLTLSLPGVVKQLSQMLKDKRGNEMSIGTLQISDIILGFTKSVEVQAVCISNALNIVNKDLQGSHAFSLV